MVKICHNFKAKIHQIRLQLVLRPDLLMKLTVFPQSLG